MSYINFNGRIFQHNEPVITADNRGLRFGDGLFETMKMAGGDIRFGDWHFERLFDGLKLLQFELPDYFTPAFLTREIVQLAAKNNCPEAARIRLMVVRGNGGLYDPENNLPNYIIQCYPLPLSSNALNDQGFQIGVYEGARKAVDGFSNLKSNNFLAYFMAAHFARQKNLHDCLLLNCRGNLCEATIANCFIVKGVSVYTPSLHEGCIAGIMRRYLLEKLPALGFACYEDAISVEDLANADEVFLSNSIYGMRWVEAYGDHHYKNDHVRAMFASLFKKDD